MCSATFDKISTMKKKLICFAIIAVLITACTEDRSIESEKPIVIDPASELIYFWNFNAVVGTTTSIAPDFDSSSETASITYEGTGAGYMDNDGTIGYEDNIRNGSLAGTLLKVRNPSDTRSLFLNMPTTGYKNVILQFATARSSNTGATVQNYSYTIDGTNFIQTGLSRITHNTTPDTPDLIVLDFSTISGVNDNPNFRVKIEFAGPTVSGISGNNRIDNVTLEGIPLP
jgi:hypothetical protein